MGLDMYANKVRPDRIPQGAVVDFEVVGIDNNETDEAYAERKLHYWRKHPNLHGWMQRLYAEKGGSPDPMAFNCVNLLLTEADLAVLESDIRTGALPDTGGFFFGRTDGTETNDDLTFIRKAREAMAEGYAVFYTSWW